MKIKVANSQVPERDSIAYVDASIDGGVDMILRDVNVETISLTCKMSTEEALELATDLIGAINGVKN